MFRDTWSMVFMGLVLLLFLVVLAVADPVAKPHDYRDAVISALQIQRNQSLDAVASLNATLVEKGEEIASLQEQIKVLDEKVKSCQNAPDSKDH